MALAHLEPGDVAPGWVELVADIGTNAFYEYRIGDAEETVDYVSPLARHDGGPFASVFRIRIPAERIGRGARVVQLVTYRDSARNGPAWSRPVRVHALPGSRTDEWSDVMSARSLLPRSVLRSRGLGEAVPSIVRFEPSGQRVVLDDARRFRAYWHRVWEGDVAPDARAFRWELDVACRYELRADARATGHQRLETRALLEPSDPDASTHRIAGRMRSGMVLGLGATNELLTSLFDRAPLSPEGLAVLSDPGVLARFDLFAIVRATMHARRGVTGALWIHPELELHRVTSRDVAGTERTVELPVPIAIHLLTCRASTDPASAAIDGHDIVSRARASLVPSGAERG
ncbi:hypothetical protein [Sandaracinus amylolyticus]|uniref:hypothetical protein n=1 Tax=Sandaracinus amylolyticus TaxID=927083 RepID=UPI001F2CB86A|nr:hypothetical protein [Sandaracinus amylolyticus]UJR82742.1 Hypothetical protein I5071_48070 [Sandaracinus amylolyticus]